MQTELRGISYVVLSLVGDGGASPHELARMVRQGGPVYWTAAESKVYAEPKRLAALGYLRGRVTAGETREKTVYTLTAKGRRALREWLRSPARFPRIQDGAHLRLLAGDQITDEEILTSLEGLRSHLAELNLLVDEMEAGEAALPEKRRNLALAHRLARRMLAAYDGWIDEVEAELASGRTGVSAPRETPGSEDEQETSRCRFD
jgi:DNA-binding PadR family transcriptional regulator